MYLYYLVIPDLSRHSRPVSSFPTYLVIPDLIGNLNLLHIAPFHIPHPLQEGFHQRKPDCRVYAALHVELLVPLLQPHHKKHNTLITL